MNIALVGYGAMGKMVEEVITDNKLFVVAPEVSYHALNEISEKIDVIIDFSNPANLDMIIDYSKVNKTPVVFATTGYNEEQLEKINELSKEVAVLKSANFSLGVILLNKLVKEITPLLQDDYDIEVIEAHHNRKLDAPSGTAKMLVNTINESKHGKNVYGRSGIAKREANEVGIHSIRGGTIVGEHEVLYCGTDEVITLKHSASSRKVFAKGAYVAAKFLVNKQAGYYTMDDVLL